MTPCMSCPYLLFINTDVQISAANSVGTYAAQQFLQEHEHEVVGSKSNMQLVTLQRRSQAFVHRPNQFETSWRFWWFPAGHSGRFRPPILGLSATLGRG